MRVALTIALNAQKHIENWGQKNLETFDHWIVVEGAVDPINCTSWCKDIDDKWLGLGGISSGDKTLDVLRWIGYDYDNLLYIMPPGTKWKGKQEMIDTGIRAILEEHLRPDFIWQVDSDEYWEREDIESAENRLRESNAMSSTFLTDTVLHLGKDYWTQVFGSWGEGKDSNFRRLHIWKPNFRFVSHEPPRSNIEGTDITWISNPERPLHLSYFYEEDVKFKSEFYDESHSMVYEGWQRIRDMAKGNMPQLDISALFCGKKPVPMMLNTVIRKMRPEQNPRLWERLQSLKHKQ